MALIAAERIGKHVHLPSDGTKWMSDTKAWFMDALTKNKNHESYFIVHETKLGGLQITSCLSPNERGYKDFKTLCIKYGDDAIFDECVKEASDREIGFYLISVENDLERLEKLLKRIDFDVKKIDPWCQHMLLVVSPFTIFDEQEKARISLLLSKTNIEISKDHQEIASRYNKLHWFLGFTGS